MARACALVYKRGVGTAGLRIPPGLMGAITSHPLLMAALGKAYNHADQTTPYLTHERLAAPS